MRKLLTRIVDIGSQDAFFEHKEDFIGIIGEFEDYSNHVNGYYLSNSYCVGYFTPHKISHHKFLRHFPQLARERIYFVQIKVEAVEN